MNNDTKNDDISQLYQSLSKDEPNGEIDKAILAAAKAKLDKQTIINKKNTQAWWLGGRFHGAIAASALLLCLVYILPPNYVNAPVTDAESPTLDLNKVETQTPNEQKMQMRMITQGNEAENIQKSALTSPQTEVMRESQPAFDEVMDTNKLQLAKSKEQLNKGTGTQNISTYADIKEKTEKLLTKLSEIQKVINLSHDEIINQSIFLVKAKTTEIEEQLLVEQYKSMHHNLVKNLNIISLQHPENLQISKYKEVLSEQEYLDLLEATKN